MACSLGLAQAPLAWAQPPATKAAPAAPAATPKTPSADKAGDLNAAKKAYAEGEKKFKAGDFAGALADFTSANDIKSTPHAERYLGLCEDSLGHYPAAVDWYEKFLAHVPDKLALQGDEIRKREGEIKAMPGKVHIESTPPGATVTVDDKPQASPAPFDVELAPGSHVVKFSAPGRAATAKTIDVTFASTQTVSGELDELPPAVAPPPPIVAAAPLAPVAPIAPVTPPEPRSIVPAIVTGGLAIAAAGVGTVFGIIALNDKSDFDKNPTSHTADNGDTHALIADMAFGVALTFGVTSAVLLLTKDEPPSATSSTRARAHTATITPTPIVGPHIGGAGLVLKF
ncbi:MAG TPA: PEGA domain-containing protein [Polyangiaceae bacterium]|nr:PEGA domain-containing protein [Polyangiaceae bacterium]